MTHLNPQIIATCPKCGTSIGAEYSYSWCNGCYTPLPEDIKLHLPKVKSIENEEFASSHRVLSNNSFITIVLGISGLLVGGILGYLMRPSVPMIGQLDFFTVITRGANLHGLDQILISAAESSSNYLLIGSIAGCIIGLVIGLFRPTKFDGERTIERGFVQKQVATEQHVEVVNKQPQVTASKNDIAGHLRLLADLRSDGLITEEEFQQKKNELLSRI